MAKKPGWGPLPRGSHVSAASAPRQPNATWRPLIRGSTDALAPRQHAASVAARGATVRVDPASVGACGLTGAPIRSIPAAFASFCPDEDGGVGGERR